MMSTELHKEECFDLLKDEIEEEIQEVSKRKYSDSVENLIR